MSIVFFHNDQQKMLAEKTKTSEENAKQKKFYTEIRTFDKFYLAEAYHQKYWLQQSRDFMEEFNEIYYDFSDIIDSTSAARVNGYLGGNGTCNQLKEELSSYGLSDRANKKLLDMMCPNVK
jgi:peptide-methionine (S)-S-oxide reductase